MAQINSYVSDRRKRRRKVRIYFLGVLAFLFVYLIFAGTFWCIFHAPFFRVDEVVVQGNQTISSAQVTSLLQASIINNGDVAGGKHSGLKALLGMDNMLVWPDTISSSDLALIPQLADVSISKDYWAHTITVNVTERNIFAIWCFDAGVAGATDSAGSAGAASSTTSAPVSADTVNGEQCYSFDNTGTIFERTLDTQGGAISVIHDYSQKIRGLNEQVLPTEFVPNLISIVNVVHVLDLPIASIALNDISLEQINVTTVNGPAIYFSLRFPADEYLSVIQSLIQQPDFDKIGYIDCTTQNRLYYK